MNRLQKKCLFAAAGTHLLIVVVVLCSGFVRSTPKVDQTDLLTVIPSTAIDALLNSGVKTPTPPAPAPIVTPPTPTPTPPTPEPPKPVVTPPQPVEPVTPPEHTDPDFIPVKTPDKPTKRQNNTSDFTPVKRTDADAAAIKKAAQDAQRKQDQQKQAIARAMSAISKHASSATEVEMPGTSSASYANYGAIVVSVYHNAWVAPDSMTSESAVVSFSVTIARDGSVISSRITQASGESNVDHAVQRMLNRVTFIHVFPDDTKDSERTYNIDFNATRTSIQ